MIFNGGIIGLHDLKIRWRASCHHLCVCFRSRLYITSILVWQNMGRTSFAYTCITEPTNIYHPKRAFSCVFIYAPVWIWTIPPEPAEKRRSPFACALHCAQITSKISRVKWGWETSVHLSNSWHNTKGSSLSKWAVISNQCFCCQMHHIAILKPNTPLTCAKCSNQAMQASNNAWTFSLSHSCMH